MIVSSFVIFVSQGVDAEISVNTLNDGYAIYKPVLGDMMSHAHHVPQVTVAVNGIPSHCDGACSFEWTESSTPNITSVSPESGNFYIMCVSCNVLLVRHVCKLQCVICFSSFMIKNVDDAHAHLLIL